MNRVYSGLDHDLSPLPLFTVCVGYWLPLEWMLRGTPLLTNMSFGEAFGVLAASVAIYFVPFTLLVALLIYLAAPAALLASIPYRRAVRFGMDLVANALVIVITYKTMREVAKAANPSPLWFKGLFLIALSGAVLWMTLKNFSPSRYLALPRRLALIAVPLALGMVLWEGIDHAAVRAHPPAARTMPSKEARPPDIILVTFDALSSHHLSCYGYSRSTSPHLDAFAKEAILFERFYANSNWTRPGVASLLNGSRPWTHAADLGRPIRSEREAHNLLGVLARSGYEVRTVSANAFADHFWQGTPVACSDQVWVNFSNVYQRMLGPFPQLLPSTVAARSIGPAYYLSLGLERLDAPSPRDRIAQPLIQSEKMLSVAPRDRPVFFWLHLLPPHDPYVVHEPYLGTFEASPLARTPGGSIAPYLFAAGKDAELQRVLQGRYDESILAADEGFGRLMAWLKAQGRYENSLVVVSADHGESFSHGYGGHGGPLLLEELIRVPCLIKRPGQRAPERVTQLFEQADLAPTLLHMAGLPIPPGMEGQPYPVKTDGLPVFAMNRDMQTREGTFSLAMCQGAWKYVVHYGPWAHPWPRRELYDLGADPEEHNNLVAQRPEVAEPMNRRVVEELAKRGLRPDSP